MATFDNYISPWLALVDDVRFQRTVDRVANLHPTAMAGCHTPAIRGRHVAAAIGATRRSPGASFPREPDQAVLDEIHRALQIAA